MNITSLEWTEFDGNGDAPLPLDGGCIEKFEDTIYYIGQSESKKNNGIYKYSIFNQTWEFVKVSGKFTKRAYHKTALIGNEIYVIAGRNTDSFNNVKDIVKLNISASDLEWKTVKSIPEDFVSDSFGITIKGNTIFVFGGYKTQYGQLTNHLYLFQTENSTLTTLSNDFLCPPARYFHSMNLISGEFYVFGGRNYDTVFNDLWKFNPETSTWTSIQTIGIIPSARYAFAAKSQGDALAIWGGENKIGLLNDMYIYNSLKNSWELIVPESTILPNPAIGACLVMSIPKIYIYGGATASGLNNELWEFNLWTNEYVKLSSDKPVSFATCELENYYFYVIFGSEGQGYPKGVARKYSLEDDVWTTHYKFKDFRVGSVEGIQIFINGNILKIGGQVYEFLPSNEIFYFAESGSEHYLGNISQSIYRAAYVYYGSLLYIFGGGVASGYSLRLSISNSNLLVLSIPEIMSAGDLDFECSPGTESSKSKCEICKAGSYSEGISNSSCILCSEGTYNSKNGGTSNRQCYPCDNNFYNSQKGQVYCVNCPTGYECPTGSSKPLDLLIENKVKSKQPKMYEPNDASEKIFNFQLTVGLTFFGLILGFLSFTKTREFLIKLDLYSDLHNFILNQPMYLITNKFGGVFSLIFICLAIILFGTTIINYNDSNILETKGLVPKVVLDYEVDDYVADEFIVIVQFIRYGDKCKKEFIDYTPSSISYASDSIVFELVNDTCVITIKYKSCVLSTGASITLTSKEKLCYSSGIYVNVTSSSSIPKEISSILTVLKPTVNYVFIGTKPSKFFFTMTPSLFRSDSNKWPKKLTGYHVSSENLPISGSEHESKDLAIASQLKLLISMDLSISGLFTKRSLIRDLGILFSSLIGSIFGVMGAVGGGMALLEKRSGKFREKLKKKKDFCSVADRRKAIENEILDQEEDSKGIIENEELDSERFIESPRNNRI